MRELGSNWGCPRNGVPPSVPGPARCAHLGEVRAEYAELLRRADAIFIDELRAAGWYEKTAQAFAGVSPVRSVGVMGDGRTYEYVVALRAVQSADFMTAQWAELPHSCVARVQPYHQRGARHHRVVYDIGQAAGDDRVGVEGNCQECQLTLTMYGIRNCDTVKKARSWLEARGHEYSFHDYKTAGIERSRLESWCGALGWEALLNRAGTTFRKLPDADKQGLDTHNAISLMVAQPSLIKRPVLDLGGRLLVGFKRSLTRALCVQCVNPDRPGKRAWCAFKLSTCKEATGGQA